MAQSATATYNEHCRAEFAAESIRNYIVNSGTNNHSSSIRRRLLDECRCLEELLEADETPIIIAPSGMLSGGFSPTYLLEFCQRYDDARVILCGYQAEGTPGRQLEDAIEEDLERVGVTLPSNGLNGGIPDEGDGTRVKVPVSWISRYHGLSAHARNTLLQFARQVSPSQVYLIHGEQEQQEKMAQHLVDNLDSVSEIQLTGMMHPVSVTPDLPEEEIVGDRPAKRILDERGADIEVGDSAQFGSDAIHGTLSEFSDQIEALELALRTLSGQLAVERHDSGFSEEDIRRIVRDEMDEIVREAVEESQSN